MENHVVSTLEPAEHAVSAPVAAPASPAQPIAPRLAPAAVPLKKFVGIALTRAVPMLVYQANRVGRSGMAGAALILFACVFFCAAVLPQYARISALRGEILQAQHGVGADASPHVRLNRFMDGLPKRSQLPDIAGQIFTLAAAAGVTLDRGHYELAPLHSGHLARYRMTFPIKGPYPAIRHFIDATLLAIPSAAVEGLRLERKTAADGSVDAELGFSVFVRNES
jgi:hypothetical protein